VGYEVQVAGNRPDYLEGARRELHRAGVSQEAIERSLSGDLDGLEDWHFREDVPLQERARSFSNFFQAVRISLVASEDIKLAPTKHVSFDDRSMEEASKAYLFGFYQASIALCASTVEIQLKRICGSDKRLGALEMIERVERKCAIGRDPADHCRELFKFRNRVLHDGRMPQADKAKEMLGVARLLVTELRACPEQT
jgi:hypothetical protein